MISLNFLDQYERLFPGRNDALSKTFLKILFLELLAITIIIKHYQEIISLIVHNIGDIPKKLTFTGPQDN